MENISNKTAQKFYNDENREQLQYSLSQVLVHCSLHVPVSTELKDHIYYLQLLGQCAFDFDLEFWKAVSKF